MWDEGFETDTTMDWAPVALRGGVARLRVPADWQRISRDDGGLAYQSPGDNPVDLLVSVTTYRNPYGVSADEAIQYLDRENVLPRGISPSGDDDDLDRRWIAYAVAQPPDRQIFVWKVAEFSPPDHVRVVTLQLHVPEVSEAQPELADLIDRLGEEAARVEFSDDDPVTEPVQRVTMRNVGHGDLVRFRLPWDWQSEPDGELTMFYRDEPGTGTLRVAVHAFPYDGRESLETGSGGAGEEQENSDLRDATAVDLKAADLNLADLDADEFGAGADLDDDEDGDGIDSDDLVMSLLVAPDPEAEIAARVVLRQTAEQFADGPDGRVGEGSVEWLPEGEVMARFATDGEEDGEKLRFHLWLRGSVADGQTTLALFSYALGIDKRDSDIERTTLGMLEREIRSAIVGLGAEESDD